MTQREILESYMKNFKLKHPKLVGATYDIMRDETGIQYPTLRRLMSELKNNGTVKQVNRIKIHKKQFKPVYAYVPKQEKEILVKATQTL